MCQFFGMPVHLLGRTWLTCISRPLLNIMYATASYQRVVAILYGDIYRKGRCLVLVQAYKPISLYLCMIASTKCSSLLLYLLLLCKHGHVDSVCSFYLTGPGSISRHGTCLRTEPDPCYICISIRSARAAGSLCHARVVSAMLHISAFTQNVGG